MNDHHNSRRGAAILFLPAPIDIYAGTPASTPKGTLGAQWATYEPERFPPTSTPGP